MKYKNDIAVPPRCFVCGQIVLGGERICAVCAIKRSPEQENEPIDNGEDKFICSICNGYVYHYFGRSEYCPRCGRKMYANGGTISKERFIEIMKGE